MLEAILTKADMGGVADWKADEEPLPPWLQPKQDDEEAHEQVAKKA